MFKDVKNPDFKKKSLPLLILGLFMYYFFCITVSEQISILVTYLTAETGWTVVSIVQPITYASIVSIVMVVVINTLFMKISAKIVIVIATVAMGISCALVGVSGAASNYALFFVALFLMRVLCSFLTNGCNYLCGNWFIRKRGTSLGIVTIGGPVSSATFVALATVGVTGALGFGGTYYVIAALIILLAVAMGIWLKDSPQQVGLLPDGDEAPAESIAVEKPKAISTKEILLKADSWLLVVSFGILQFGISCITAYFAAVMISKGVSASYYLPALTIGAIIGMPISYALGVIDDKYGTVKASLCLCALYIVGFAGMILTNGNNIATIGLATVGMAGITGGAPNLTPSMNYYVFGKSNYLASTRVIGALQSIIAAFGVTYIATFVGMGKVNLAYTILICGVVVAAICIAAIGRKPSYDRQLIASSK